ncbi:MAG: pyrimidine dimer DNA glycosylase/endonuclease V [Halanaerobiales bacterium]
MRMWMTDVKNLCNQHLQGEHVEIHMLAGTLKKKMSVKGYIDNNLIEVSSMKQRHDEIAKEMVRRGMNHKSPLEVPDYSYLPKKHKKYKIDIDSAEKELKSRCNDCFK